MKISEEAVTFFHVNPTVPISENFWMTLVPVDKSVHSDLQKEVRARIFQTW